MKKLVTLTFIFSIFISSQAFAARVVAVHDEWPFSDLGFTQAGTTNATTFVENLATFLSGSVGSSNFLIYTDSAGLAGSSFQNALSGAGHTFDFILSTNALPSDLTPYDGIFLSGLKNGADAVTLTNYVNNNNGVYIAAGNSYFPNVEADRWNSFLNTFGLTFDTQYNGLQGVFAQSGTNPITAGVAALYYDNGNNVSTFGGISGAAVIESSLGGGTIGIYEAPAGAPIPEPASMLLLGSAGVMFARRKRRS